jgi:hypothetical protein
MPELLEISGLGQEPGQEPEQSKHACFEDLLVLAAGALVVWLLAKGVPKILGLSGDECLECTGEDLEGLDDLGVIVKCRKEDMKMGRPEKQQQWCLWDSKQTRILGRHPTRSKALGQERAIQARKRG